MSCEACRGVQGATHTCAASGVHIAAEAHVAGAVEEIAQAWPRWQVTTHFRMRGADEATVRASLTGLMTTLLEDDLVEDVDFTLERWEVEAGEG